MNDRKYYTIEDKSYVSATQYENILQALKEARHRIEELESELSVKENLLKIKNGLLGETDISNLLPIEVAEKLINAESEYETNDIQRAFGEGEKIKHSVFSVSDLRQIAEHLTVYCDHNS